MISNLENTSIQELEGRNAINHFYPFSNKDYVSSHLQIQPSSQANIF